MLLLSYLNVDVNVIDFSLESDDATKCFIKAWGFGGIFLLLFLKGNNKKENKFISFQVKVSFVSVILCYFKKNMIY